MDPGSELQALGIHLVTMSMAPHKRYDADQRRTYGELWEHVLKLAGLESRNRAQMTFDERRQGAAHHDRLAEPGYELIGIVDRLAPRLEPAHHELIRAYATSYCNYHVGRRMEYLDNGCEAPGEWTAARGTAWKKLFFDDRIELERVFREVLTSGDA